MPGAGFSCQSGPYAGCGMFLKDWTISEKQYKERGFAVMQGEEREYLFTLLRPDDTGPAWRQELELVFILEGGGSLRIEGADAPYPISKNDIFAINSFQLRELELDGGSLAVSLLLSPLFLSTVSPDTLRPCVNCKSFLYGTDAQQPFDVLRGHFARAFRAQYKRESPLSVHLRGRLITLIDDLFRNFLAPGQNLQDLSGRERLRGAVDYLHLHYRENVTLTQLSEAAYLSGPYLSRSFVKYLGMPFTSYVTRLRLSRAAALLAGDTTITEIAYDCGFPNANALIDAFKHIRGVTPGQYRRSLREKARNLPDEPGAEAQDGFSTAFATLMSYAVEAKPVGRETLPISCNIAVRVGGEGRSLSHTWKRMINAGYAKDLLNGSVQAQLRQLQRGVGFSYFRCKGVLDDEMLLYVPRADKKPEVSCVYLEEMIDFILSCGAKPFLELGHMPSVLAKHSQLLPGRLGQISPPMDQGAWRGLVEEVLRRLTDRYGGEELRTWLFTPWVSPAFSDFGLFTHEEYLETYESAFRAIKGVDSNLRVCAFGTNVADPDQLSELLDVCLTRGCLPDLISVRSFAAAEPDEDSGIRLIENNEAFHMAVSGDERYVENSLKRLRAVLMQKGYGRLPVLLDEWSSNIWQRDLCNDTCYKSAYLFKSILENYDAYYAMGYFSACDRLDELPPSGELFCGGFGLFTHNGIPKSALRALELLAHVGDTLLASGESYFVTRRGDELQFFLYNYSHYDLLYRYRHTTNLTRTDRYRVLNEATSRAYHIQLDGVCPGAHTVRRYSVGPHGGSSFDAWTGLGAPERLNTDERETLLRLSHPVYHTETMSADHSLAVHAMVHPLEVQLITIFL